MFFVITIAFLVCYLLFQFATKFHYSHTGPLAEKILSNTTLEVLWTILPTMIVLAVAIPSLTMIYSMDQHNDRPGEHKGNILSYPALHPPSDYSPHVHLPFSRSDCEDHRQAVVLEL